jgi:hypothetical protein
MYNVCFALGVPLLVLVAFDVFRDVTLVALRLAAMVAFVAQARAGYRPVSLRTVVLTLGAVALIGASFGVSRI